MGKLSAECKRLLCHATGGQGSIPNLAASRAGGDDDQMEEAVDAMIRFVDLAGQQWVMLTCAYSDFEQSHLEAGLHH